jgi:hypothetical protein
MDIVEEANFSMRYTKHLAFLVSQKIKNNLNFEKN